MSIIAEPFKKDNETFPQNKIILTDGTTLDCYPITDKEPENIPDDTLQPDTTGQYLRIGRHKATPAPQPATERAGQELFIDNAFYLLAHICSTIGINAFHFSVRNGKRWNNVIIST